jgi:pyrophosphatase PpaX
MNEHGRQLAILFDLDGTLVDSIELILSAAEHAFAGRPGRAASREEFRSGIGRPLAEQFGPYCANAEELEALIAAYRGYQLEHHDRLTNAYPGIADAVRELAGAGHALAVVTSKMGAMAQRAVRYVGLESHIPLIVGCDATERHKPDPEPVLFALAHLGIAPADAIFLGDSPYDMEAGRAAGVTTVAALWGAFPREILLDAGAQHALAHPSELTELVRIHSMKQTHK